MKIMNGNRRNLALATALGLSLSACQQGDQVPGNVTEGPMEGNVASNAMNSAETGGGGADMMPSNVGTPGAAGSPPIDNGAAGSGAAGSGAPGNAGAQP